MQSNREPLYYERLTKVGVLVEPKSELINGWLVTPLY